MIDKKFYNFNRNFNSLSFKSKSKQLLPLKKKTEKSKNHHEMCIYVDILYLLPKTSYQSDVTGQNYLVLPLKELTLYSNF